MWIVAQSSGARQIIPEGSQVSGMNSPASKEITPVQAKPSPARIPRSVGSSEVAPAGDFQEDVRKAVLRWINRGRNSGSSFVEEGSVSFFSAIGKRDENQDRSVFLRLIPQQEAWPMTTALVLCDGMGGMREGATAAELAVSSFVAAFSASKSSSLVDQLRNATEVANEEVFKRYSGKGGATLSAIGSTSNGDWACVNVGDSRVYGFLKSGEVKQISTDDSLGNVLSGMDVPTPPAQFRELLQYVGMGKGIQVHGIPVSSPDLYHCLFLTSDGAHEIDQQLFKEIVVSAGSSREIARRLTVLSEWKGGKDNATVAAWDISPGAFMELSPADRGYLEMWSLSGKFEITSRQEPRHSIFRGKDPEPSRPRRRKPPSARKAGATLEASQSSQETDSTQIQHDAPRDANGDIRSANTVIKDHHEPQLRIELSET
jgi:PPM family protein phosphatase